MSYTSRLKLSTDNFSPDTDLIEVFSKKAGVVGVINPKQIASPSGAAGAIQFSDGSAFSSDAANLIWDNTNKRLGIGTNAPSADLHIDGHSGFGASLKITTNKANSVAYVQMVSDYITGFEQYQYGGPGWGWPNWTTTRAGGTAAAPTAVPSNYGLNEYTFWGHDGTASGQAYSMMTRTAEVWTSAAHGIYTTFSTVVTGSTALTERMRFTGSGNITFNNASDTAKVSIKGSGSTSATTSLLVQNSSGTELFRVRDDGNFNLANGYLFWGGIGFGSYIGSDGYDMYYNTRQDSKPHIFYSGGVEFVRFIKISATDVRLIVNAGNGLASAILQADSTTQGFLPPRMTTAQKNAIATPAAGLEVFDTTLGRPCFYSGSAWVTL